MVQIYGIPTCIVIPAIFTCCGLIRVIREGGKRRGKRGEGRKRGEGKREKRKKIVLFHL